MAIDLVLVMKAESGGPGEEVRYKFPNNTSVSQLRVVGNMVIGNQMAHGIPAGIFTWRLENTKETGKEEPLKGKTLARVALDKKELLLIHEALSHWRAGPIPDASSKDVVDRADKLLELTMDRAKEMEYPHEDA